jgi:hypothetical protein
LEDYNVGISDKLVILRINERNTPKLKAVSLKLKNEMVIDFAWC